MHAQKVCPRGEKNDFDVFMYLKREPEGRVGRHRLPHRHHTSTQTWLKGQAGHVSEWIRCCRRGAGLSQGLRGLSGTGRRGPTQTRQETSSVRLSEAAEPSPDSLTSVTCAQCEQGANLVFFVSRHIHCVCVWQFGQTQAWEWPLGGHFGLWQWS